MRIVGGKYRGKRLAAPGAAGGGDAHLRPTSDRVREALFNVLAHGAFDGAPEGMQVLDLFAGTGALGLEALSRGAKKAVFIDDFAMARSLIRENIETLDVAGETKLWRRDATRLGPCRGGAYDLIFLDPPYNSDLGVRAIQSALDGGWVAANAIVVLEGSINDPVPSQFPLLPVDERRYGETRIMIFRHLSDNPLGSTPADA